MDLKDSIIRNRLKKHRKQNSYTQKQVAFLLGINATDRVSRWERGETLPGLINLIKLSLIYHVFPTDLYYDLMRTLRKDLQGRLQSQAFEDLQSDKSLDDD